MTAVRQHLIACALIEPATTGRLLLVDVDTVSGVTALPHYRGNAARTLWIRTSYVTYLSVLIGERK